MHVSYPMGCAILVVIPFSGKVESPIFEARLGVGRL